MSHRAYVSGVSWDPERPHNLSSCSYDGTVKTWDVRCSLPLHTVRAQAKGDEAKGLAVCYGHGALYAAGSDCEVKRFGVAADTN